MTTFIGIICGLIIAWLLLTAWAMQQEVRRTTEELAAARAQLTKLRRELTLAHALLEAEKRKPFGSNYVQPFSILSRN